MEINAANFKGYWCISQNPFIRNIYRLTREALSNGKITPGPILEQSLILAKNDEGGGAVIRGKISHSVINGLAYSKDILTEKGIPQSIFRFQYDESYQEKETLYVYPSGLLSQLSTTIIHKDDYGWPWKKEEKRGDIHNPSYHTSVIIEHEKTGRYFGMPLRIITTLTDHITGRVTTETFHYSFHRLQRAGKLAYVEGKEYEPSKVLFFIH